jgi:hypothetical protein
MNLERIDEIIAKNITITDKRLYEGVFNAVLEAVNEENEACAKVCEENGDKWADGSDEWRNGQATASYYCAIAIRARGET